jgi:hypothetical protein
MAIIEWTIKKKIGSEIKFKHQKQLSTVFEKTEETEETKEKDTGSGRSVRFRVEIASNQASKCQVGFKRVDGEPSLLEKVFEEFLKLDDWFEEKLKEDD